MNSKENITLSQLETLYTISQKINSQLNLDVLLQDIMDLAVKLMKAEKGIVFLKKTDSDELDLKVARTKDKKSLENILAMSKSIVSKVFRTGESIVIEKTSSPEGGDGTKSMFRFKIISLLCVPLKSRSEIIGVIYLDTTKLENLFKKEDVAFLESFSNLAAIALENARNYKQISDMNKNLEFLVDERTQDLKNKNKQLIEANTTIRDTQLQLIRSEKMASLGRLSAGLSHEINNPLGSLKGNIDLFTKTLDKLNRHFQSQSTPGDSRLSDKIQKLLDALLKLNSVNSEASRRIGEIISSLKNFARLDESELKEVDIHDGINSSIKLIRNLFEKNVEITTEFGKVPQILCKAGQLNQVIMNILLNACESIDSMGKVNIKTSFEAGNIFIKISDTGRGIPVEHRDKIFDPGFTTKSRGIGSGLGLSISYQIIKEHAGELNFASEINKGSEFTIKIPGRRN